MKSISVQINMIENYLLKLCYFDYLHASDGTIMPVQYNEIALLINQIHYIMVCTSIASVFIHL